MKKQINIDEVFSKIFDYEFYVLPEKRKEYQALMEQRERIPNPNPKQKVRE